MQSSRLVQPRRSSSSSSRSLFDLFDVIDAVAVAEYDSLLGWLVELSGLRRKHVSSKRERHNSLKRSKRERHDDDDERRDDDEWLVSRLRSPGKLIFDGARLEEAVPGGQSAKNTSAKRERDDDDDERRDDDDRLVVSSLLSPSELSETHDLAFLGGGILLRFGGTRLHMRSTSTTRSPSAALMRSAAAVSVATDVPRTATTMSPGLRPDIAAMEP